MDDRQYRQFCSLQEQIRTVGFPQDFDNELKTGVQAGGEYFGLACNRWGSTSNDRVYFQLNFYKLDGGDDFYFDHFQATYRKPIVIPNIEINGVDLSQLEYRMSMIDWNFLVQQPRSRDVFVASGQQVKDIIMGIVEDLETLGSTDEGRKLCDLIETKYLSDTTPVKHTELQAKYDQINKPYEVEVLIPVRGHVSVDVAALDDAIYNDLPLPAVLSQRHEIYRVDTVGHDREPDGTLSFKPFLERHYFSSLHTAVGFIQQVGDKSFQPYHVLRDRNLRAYREMSILDELTNEGIAGKYGVWAPFALRDESANIIRWRLEENMSIEQFERLSSFQISRFGSPGHQPGVFQQYPPIQGSLDSLSNEALQKKMSQRPKRKGRHL